MRQTCHSHLAINRPVSVGIGSTVIGGSMMIAATIGRDSVVLHPVPKKTSVGPVAIDAPTRAELIRFNTWASAKDGFRSVTGAKRNVTLLAQSGDRRQSKLIEADAKISVRDSR